MQTGRERLHEYRRRCRLKQYELAELLGFTESYVSQVLSGKRRPGLDTAVRIEAMTGVPVESWSEHALAKSAHARTRRERKPHSNKELTHAARS